MIGLLTSTWVNLNDVVRRTADVIQRAGWRGGMFSGVLLGGVLAMCISPTPTGATVSDTLTNGASASVRILQEMQTPRNSPAGRGILEANKAVRIAQHHQLTRAGGH